MNNPREIKMAAIMGKGKIRGIKTNAMPAKKPVTLNIPCGYKLGVVSNSSLYVSSQYCENSSLIHKFALFSASELE